MRTLAVGFLILAACKQEAHVGTGSAVHAGSDSWAVAPGSASASSSDDPPSMLARHERAERLCPTVTPFFFELSKDGKVSHILGTRHIGVPFKKLPQVVHDDLHAAKLAIFEVAPDDKSSFEAPEEPLRNEVGEPDWKHFESLVGHSIAHDLEHASASTAALALLVEFEDITAILDKEIQDDVASSNIKSGGLETAEFQDHVLGKLLDLRMLKATIETTADRAEMDKDAAKDLREYCAGADHTPGTDDETRAKMKKSGYTDAEIDAMDETLVFSRNRDWIPKFEQLFAQGDVFVAVGADHLIGDKGVIALLRARGFTATRITK
jgi:uncharacterized protein